MNMFLATHCNSLPGLGGSFLAWKASWALSECLPTKSADYCMLLISGLG